MNMNRIIVSVILGLASIGPGFAQSANPPPSGSQKQGVTQPRGSDVANRGGTKQRQPRPSAAGDPQSSDPSDTPSAEDERMNRILNGICRGC